MYRMIDVEYSIKIESLVGAIDAVRPKNFYFSGEMHDFWEVVFVRSGYAMAAAEEKIYKLSPGYMLFHKPMEFHRIWSDGNSTPHLIIISFRASGKGMDFFKDKCFSVRPELFAEYEETAELFAKTVKAYNSGGEEYAILSERAAASLKGFLLELTEAERGDAQLSFEEEERYKTIMKIMNAQCCENLSLKEIAGLCGMSVSTLKRSFARFSDKGVAQVFRTIKMREALRLLSEGNSAVSTAMSVGFNDPAYFHTVFKREFGITPLEYKRSKK